MAPDRGARPLGSIGRELLDREAKKYRVALATILESEEIEASPSNTVHDGRRPPLAGLGYGKMAVSTVVNRFLPPDALAEPKIEEAREARPPADGIGRRDGQGVDDVLIRFAKCCGPRARGRDRGLHHPGSGTPCTARDCLNLAGGEVDSERTVTVEWASADQQALPVKIAVHIGRDRPGLLAEISTAISSRQANIVKAEVTVTEDRKGLNHFTVEVRDLDQLQGVMGAIAAVKDVIGVERVRGL